MKKAEQEGSAGAPRRGRGRPRTFDREEALGVATRLFWLKGYEGTSIVDLTKAIGIEAPSLYAAFGSKKDLYVAALRHYGETYESFVWDGFRAAATARDAVQAYLVDSAAALTGSLGDVPRGCMATLSNVGGVANSELGRLLRATVYDRLRTCLERAVSEGDISIAVDIASLARFVQNTQSGMSILARDGAGHQDLKRVAEISMLAWDAVVNRETALEQSASLTA